MTQTATPPDAPPSTPLATPTGPSAANPAANPAAPPPQHGRVRRLLRGRPDDHPAVRGLLLALLAATGALYLWDLGASGWANSFYAAAVQAGSESWKAFFFGSSDAANAITVDKTPLSLWPMALSARVFGLSSWSMLVPQALMGVATVALVHASVRRATGNAWAGLLAGAVLAVTPVAVLMFRFNNPDAALVLLLTGAVYATQRAIDAPERAVRWIALGGALVGLGFLAKMLQAFLVLPGLALVYLLCASVPLLARVRHLLVAFAAMVAAGGWWIAIVELWPASSRPYIGGSQNDSILELTLGYNGLGRLNGEETGSVGGGRGWGETGIGRLLGADVGGQAGWLLPAALLLLASSLWFVLRSRERTTARRAALAGTVVWGGWLLVTAATFSFMAGIFHAYYTVALAPAIAALVGIGTAVLWQHRGSWTAPIVAAAALALTTVTSLVLLARSTDFAPWLHWVVAGAGVVAVVGALLPALLRLARLGTAPRRVGIAVAAAMVIAALAGPAAYAVDTATTPHTGSIPSAGPTVAGARSGPGGPGGGPQGAPPGMGQGTAPGGAGGLLQGSEPSAELTALLSADAASYTWIAAAVGSNSASGYQLASGQPVMAIGGFNGSDPSPTLAEFQALVADGDIHWFIAGGMGGGMRGGPQAEGGTSSQITSWVESTFTATTVDGVTLYDLTAPTGGGAS